MATKAAELESAARGEGCLGRSQDDEPVFVLCARDPTSAELIRQWARLAEHRGVRAEKTHEARMLASRMDIWREEHAPAIQEA